jgi:hypothetical protein
MKVRALVSFSDEAGSHSIADEFEMADAVAVIRIRGGLVEEAPAPASSEPGRNERSAKKGGHLKGRP